MCYSNVLTIYVYVYIYVAIGMPTSDSSSTTQQCGMYIINVVLRCDYLVANVQICTL